MRLESCGFELGVRYLNAGAGATCWSVWNGWCELVDWFVISFGCVLSGCGISSFWVSDDSVVDVVCVDGERWRAVVHIVVLNWSDGWHGEWCICTLLDDDLVRVNLYVVRVEDGRCVYGY
jgi:hypothetical protein